MYSIQKLISILKQEDGYIEKKKNCPTANLYEKVGAYAGADNWTKYWKDMADLGLTNYQGSYYCIATLFWGMVQAFGLKAAQDLCLQKFMINCQQTYNLFKAKNQMYSSPAVGDIVVFWNGSRFNHAELVVEVNGDVCKTFGANTSAVTTTTVYNGGGCRYGKVYSITAMKKSSAKFLRPNYGSQVQEGWIELKDTGGKSQWKYQLSDGAYVTSAWKQINNKYYTFDENGIMRTGWFYDTNVSQWYYLSEENGDMKSDWQLIDGKWHYFKESGEMKIGWLQLNDVWYYLADKDGTMAVGLQKIKRLMYFFDDDGKMISGQWKQVGNDWYYFSSTGAAYYSKWKQGVDGKYYYLMENSIMATNCYVKEDNETKTIYYYVDKNGVWDGKELTTVKNNVKVVK